MRPGHAIRRPILLLAIVGSLLLAGCNRSSESDIANAKASGAAEEATKQKDQRQADEQARLAAEVKKLQAEAAKKGAATASAAAPAAPDSTGTSGASGASGASRRQRFRQAPPVEAISVWAGTRVVPSLPMSSRLSTPRVAGPTPSPCTAR